MLRDNCRNEELFSSVDQIQYSYVLRVHLLLRVGAYDLTDIFLSSFVFFLAIVESS